MLCLSCGHFQPGLQPKCSQCQAFLGYPAEGQGYLPQLLHMQTALRQGSLSESQAEDRLMRLDEALGSMVNQMDALGAQIMQLPIDDVQGGTLGGFLMPVRESLTRLRSLAAELDLGGDWSEEDWQELREAQADLLKANQGVEFVFQFLGQVASGQGIAWPGAGSGGS